MKITILMDNAAYGKGIRGEHGFSALVDAGGVRVLFDTGQSDAFLSNAEVLGVDMGSVDAVVLSHGHYDHTGGLAAFLRANRRARVYCKSAAPEPKFRGDRNIGMPPEAAAYRGRFFFVGAPVEIAPGLTIVPDIPRINEWDGHMEGFTVPGARGSVPDLFEDELFLGLKVEGGVAVLTGCSHRGVTNVAASARDLFREPIRLLLGGFHAREDPPEVIARMVGELDRLGVERLGVCHCTGVDGYAAIKALKARAAFYGHAGSIVEP